MVHFSLDHLCYFLKTFFFVSFNEIYTYLLYIAHRKVKKQEQNLGFRRLDKKTIILRTGKYFSFPNNFKIPILFQNILVL